MTKKTGISKGKPIICSGCGKKVGYVKIEKPLELESWLKKRKYRIWIWLFILGIIWQVASEVVGRLIFGDYK